MRKHRHIRVRCTQVGGFVPAADYVFAMQGPRLSVYPHVVDAETVLRSFLPAVQHTQYRSPRTRAAKYQDGQQGQGWSLSVRRSRL